MCLGWDPLDTTKRLSPGTLLQVRRCPRKLATVLYLRLESENYSLRQRLCVRYCYPDLRIMRFVMKQMLASTQTLMGTVGILLSLPHRGGLVLRSSEDEAW